MADTLLNTPLFEWHQRHAARMVEFAGWSMPIQYSSIIAEHVATRTAIGLFDISHMGRLMFAGPAVADFLDHVVTRRVANLNLGSIRYGLITNQQGGILDDVLIYCLPEPDGSARWMMVVNGSNRDKIVAWLGQQLPQFDSVQMNDITQETAMIAVQGPHAVRLVDSMIPTDLAAMKYYTGTITQVDGGEAIVSRTGYTGEDGCELIVASSAAEHLWQRLVDEGQAFGVLPAGLGARDTLRLEAGMPLYGHELSETIDPFQAGLGFAVQLKNRTFVGHDRLVAVKAQTPRLRRVGLLLEGRRTARQEYQVLAGDAVVGQVTSGTFSPTLGQPIAMAYIPPEYADPGTSLAIDIRGRHAAAEVVQLPFYTRSS